MTTHPHGNARSLEEILKQFFNDASDACSVTPHQRAYDEAKASILAAVMAVVPEEKDGGPDYLPPEATQYSTGWNACRDAMLKNLAALGKDGGENG